MVYVIYHNKQVRMCASEHRDVHGYVKRVWLIQTHPEVPLPTQQQKNKDTDVHETHTC